MRQRDLDLLLRGEHFDQLTSRPDRECDYAAKIGIGVAIDQALGWGLGSIRDRVYQLADDLGDCLGGIASVKVRDVGRWAVRHHLLYGGRPVRRGDQGVHGEAVLPALAEAVRP